MRARPLLLLFVLGACGSGETSDDTVDDRCVGTTGVQAAPATWTFTQQRDSSSCAVSIRTDVTWQVTLVDGHYEVVPSDPAIDVASTFRGGQEVPSGCAESNILQGTDDAVVDGVPTRVEVQWTLMLFEEDDEIRGDVDIEAPNGCSLTGSVTGHFDGA